jgi:hypothetical protein
MDNWAVFTGDIVRSSDLAAPDLDLVLAALQAQSDRIGQWPASTTAFARFRGDGWQMALPHQFALRAALVMRASVRATGKGRDTRIGIGLGPAELRADLAASDGPAFVRSGHALDAMKRAARMTAPDAPSVLRCALPLADRIVGGWTAGQAQVVHHLLAPAPPTQAALAQSLGTSRQMVQKQAEAAGLAALIESCEAYETAI